MTTIIDIETDGVDSKTAKVKYFGGLDHSTGELTLLPHTANEQIKDHLRKHKIWVGFNIKNFDVPILENFGVSKDYKVLIDLWECLAPKGDRGFGKYNKNRLADINPSLKLPDYKLKTIIEALGLDDEGTKGDFDYNILRDDEQIIKNKAKLEEYLGQDLKLPHKLFKWYAGIFEPLKPYIPQREFDNYKHLTCTSGCLAYKIICKELGVKEEYRDYEEARKIKQESIKIEGGHHIHARWEKVRGRIYCMDFVSHYPTIIISFNLIDEKTKEVLFKILKTRIEAKKNGDKKTALALKVPLNSFYGILGNPTFKHIYNPEGANNCTRIGRDLLKRYAQTLDVAGFKIIYGFTDSAFILIPKGLTEEDLEAVTNFYVEQEKAKMPNPIDSFGLGVDKVLKFMWFIEKQDNQYLWVDNKDQVGIKGSLFDINCPPCITELFETYIKPKIIKELDVVFSEEELLKVLKEIITKDPETSAETYSVKDVSSYKVQTSLQYQISERYGEGKHKLIPNTAGVGVGRSKDKSYCSLEDFKEHNLQVDSISLDKMMAYIKPFYTTKEPVFDLEATTQ